MYPHRCGVVPLKASIRSGKCFCCCWSADMPAPRLALITTIMAEVLMVKELTGSTTLTGWHGVWRTPLNMGAHQRVCFDGWRLVAVGRCQWTGR